MGLKQCADKLTRWNKTTFGQVPRKIQNKRKALYGMVLRDRDGSLGREINKLRKEINDLLDSEEILWQQRAKVQWLTLGDCNTKFFHSKALERRNKNTINRIQDENGVWCETEDNIAEVAVNYFERLYATSQPSNMMEITDTIQSKVTLKMNHDLINEFTKEEVELALKQMHPAKAPGPNGMLAIFFQKYWDIVGSDISSMILNALNSNMSLAEINKTNITLIPKTKCSSRMSEFRPRSLCNVIYKLVSKVLANRLKKILPHIIFDNQSTFLSERLIFDNVFVAFELMHYLDHKKEGKDRFMAVKLDMSNVYDRVEWIFTEKVMERMGFHEKRISVIMKCISTVSYSILINGVAYGCIKPTRGIRQGDPLSLYPFLLCVEGLSSMISQAARSQMLSSISICRGCPIVTHLLFADDSLLFCKVNPQECQKLTKILKLYEDASGQKINVEKSLIFFSHNTPQQLREEVLNILGSMQGSRHNKYLGLPTFIRKSKNEVFAEIKERVRKKLVGCKEKLLAMGGREILIKAVAQAVPTYTVSCFQLPKGLCEDL